MRDRARAAHLAIVLGTDVPDEAVASRPAITFRRSSRPTAGSTPARRPELERLRTSRGRRAGRARSTRPILPAEAGLDQRAVSFTKGRYPGQERLSRLHTRGHVNRTCACSRSRARPPGRRTRSARRRGGRRVTSAVPGLALAYVRSEVADDAELEVAGRSARLH